MTTYSEIGIDARGYRWARNLVIGALALGVSGLALPDAAVAGGGSGPGPREISERLERISYQVERIQDIRGRHRKGDKIDRLQARLYRLEAITEHQRGRRARRNDARIDRLQRRLWRMERRADARGHRRGHGWRDDRNGAVAFRSEIRRY